MGSGGDLKQVLDDMLTQLSLDQFGGRDAPVVTLSDDTAVDADGVLQGELRIHIRRASGESALIHTEPLEDVTTEVELRDAMAEALSKVLAVHDKWPR